jgi:hypothetical protein
MRIEKHMAHPISHRLSMQWKHLGTKMNPLYSENHAAEAFKPSDNAGGMLFQAYAHSSTINR